MTSPYLPAQARVVERIQETPSIVTLRLKFEDDAYHHQYHCEPGQFNMLYLYGVGEVPISIKDGPFNPNRDDALLDHTIRAVGRVTRSMVDLQPGQTLGVRGPYGRGWPMQEALGKNVHIITGGLGCAPAVSVIYQILAHREQYGHLAIIQGVKHGDDLIWQSQYQEWASMPNTQVLLAADQPDARWKWHQGMVTELIDQVENHADNAIAMLCGPEPMMRASAERLMEAGMDPKHIWLSLERNMHCALGHCGHCQLAGSFVCKDGPVFSYPEVRELMTIRGL